MGEGQQGTPVMGPFVVDESAERPPMIKPQPVWRVSANSFPQDFRKIMEEQRADGEQDAKTDFLLTLLKTESSLKANPAVRRTKTRRPDINSLHAAWEIAKHVPDVKRVKQKLSSKRAWPWRTCRRPRRT